MAVGRFDAFLEKNLVPDAMAFWKSLEDYNSSYSL
jgi:hypothetical protein